MRFEVKIVDDRIPQVAEQAKQQAHRAVSKTAEDVERLWKTAMEGPKSGRVYRKTSGRRRGRRGGRSTVHHQASAPGEAPAIDTGAYHGAVRARMKGEFTAWVTPGPLRYPAILEFGSRKMAKRPAAVPAAEEAWPAFEAAMRQIFK